MERLVARNKFSRPVAHREVLLDWKKRGFDCRTFVDPPGQQWNDFVHETDEVVTVIEGQLMITMESQCFLAGPGDEIFIPKNVSHSVENPSNGITRWLFGYNRPSHKSR